MEHVTGNLLTLELSHVNELALEAMDTAVWTVEVLTRHSSEVVNDNYLLGESSLLLGQQGSTVSNGVQVLLVVQSH